MRLAKHVCTRELASFSPLLNGTFGARPLSPSGDAAKTMVEKGTAINDQANWSGYSPLMVSAGFGHPDLTKFLVGLHAPLELGDMGSELLADGLHRGEIEEGGFQVHGVAVRGQGHKGACLTRS